MIFSIYSIISDHIQNIDYSQSNNATEIEIINITITKINNTPINMTVTDKNGTELYRYVPDPSEVEDYCWEGPKGSIDKP